MAPKSTKNVIKFHRGFKRKTKKDVLTLLTKSIQKKHQKSDQFLKLVKQFKLIPQPTDELDWLAQFNERGQTCEEFMKTTPIELGSEIFLYFVQIGDFDQTKLNFNDLIEYSRSFFTNKSIKLLPFKIEIKKEDKCLEAIYNNQIKKIKFRFDAKTKKMQIAAHSLFTLLRQIKPKDAHCLIGFTEYDFYQDEPDLFVAGLCDGASRVGAFSCYRYNPTLEYSEEFWFKTKQLNELTISNKQILLTRSCKLLVHETGHALGLDHCVFMDCCMNGSGHLQEDFRQSMFLCPVDLKKLSLIFKFDLVERYEKMKEFFTKIESNNEIAWLDNAISVLKSEDTYLGIK